MAQAEVFAYLRAVKASAHTLCVAPMMDWTDRHCRAFHRGLTRRALLYTALGGGLTAPEKWPG